MYSMPAVRSLILRNHYANIFETECHNHVFSNFRAFYRKPFRKISEHNVVPLRVSKLEAQSKFNNLRLMVN